MNNKIALKINNIFYYIGDENRSESQSKDGFVIINKEEIKNNWISIRYLNQTESFGCPIEKLKYVSMKITYLENYGFHVKHNVLVSGEYTFKVFYYKNLEIYTSPAFGICYTENIESLKAKEKDKESFPKFFFERNLNLNSINDFIKFLISQGENFTEEEIAKRLLKL